MKFVIAALAIASVSAKCESITTTIYEDKKCEKEDVDKTKEMAKAYDEKVLKAQAACHKLSSTSSTQLECDTKAIHLNSYKTDDCSGDKEELHKFVWGECVKMGDQYVKLKGSAALSAGVAAVLAIAATQF